MKVRVLLNSAAGSILGATGAAIEDLVADAFRKAGVIAEIRSVEREAVRDEARQAEAADVDAVVIGGGDGTLNTAAAALLGSAKPMGILALGTRNHFARDAGIPNDLDEAAAVIALGHVRAIDVGDVNGQIFLNNSSIGLYPTAVDERDELRHRHGGGKAVAMFHACMDVLRRFPLLDVTLEANGQSRWVRTPFVFVGNNRYAMNLFSLGRRETLQGGDLGVYLTRHTGRLGVLRLALMALIGRMKQDRDFRYVSLAQMEIRTRKRSLRVSLDGEVMHLRAPIRYSIQPAALRILAPEEVHQEKAA